MRWHYSMKQRLNCEKNDASLQVGFATGSRAGQLMVWFLAASVWIAKCQSILEQDIEPQAFTGVWWHYEDRLEPLKHTNCCCLTGKALFKGGIIHFIAWYLLKVQREHLKKCLVGLKDKTVRLTHNHNSRIHDDKFKKGNQVYSNKHLKSWCDESSYFRLKIQTENRLHYAVLTLNCEAMIAV